MRIFINCGAAKFCWSYVQGDSKALQVLKIHDLDNFEGKKEAVGVKNKHFFFLWWTLYCSYYVLNIRYKHLVVDLRPIVHLWNLGLQGGVPSVGTFLRIHTFDTNIGHMI